MEPLKHDAVRQASKRAFSFAEEFKKFALKGNVVDLAVGVIIGAAFGKIITSLVENIFMPVISLVLPGPESYQQWKVFDIRYGQFIADVLNFLIVAFVLFLFIVKFLGWIMRTRKEEAVAPPPPTREQELLMEIRDLLKQAKASP